MYQQKYDGRLCGLGKTTEQHRTINNSSESYLVASPTKALNLEQKVGIDECHRIDSDAINWSSRVRHEVEEAVSFGQHRNISITHSALPGLLESTFDSAWKVTANRHLIIDESFDQFCVKELSYNFSPEIGCILLSLLNFQESELSAELLEVSPSNTRRLREWAKGSTGCAVLNRASPLKAVARDVLNPMYRTLITKASQQSFIERTEGSIPAQFSIVSILRPEALDGFRSISNLSALFPMTEYALIMQAQGVTFEDVTPANSPSHYPDSSRVNIHYYTENNWSSDLRTKVDDRNRTNISKIVSHVKSQLGDSPFIFNSHTDDRKAIDKLDNAELVTETHGRNDLRKYTKAAFLGSRNITPQLAEVVKLLGIDRAAMDMARTVLAGYQFFMRTDLRVKDSQKQVDLFCCDRRTVNFMLGMFPDAHVQMHDVDLQMTKLDDLRVNNGGNRSGSGRRQLYPAGWSNADKMARRRYLKTIDSPLPEKEWYDKRRGSPEAT